MRPLDPEFVQAIEEICQEKDILFIDDEVQTGLGRTGRLFAAQNYEVHPDIITMAKGLGGGVPIGGFLVSEKTEKVLGKGDHGSTFGGNPLSARAAQTVLETILEPGFLQEVEQKGELFRSLLREIQSDDILDIRGMGLMTGIQVPQGKIADYMKQMMDRGVLVLKAGSDTIRLLPPLVITEEDLIEAAAIMKEVLEA